MTQPSTYICINCGASVRALYKKYSHSVKTVSCDKCHKIADKYIEFDPMIILVDAVLLSEEAFRHMLYNHDFKLHWKLSLVLLLLESFAQWRKKRADSAVELIELVHEKGFYICCLQNIIDYLLITFLLLLIALIQRGRRALLKTGLRRYTVTLLKAMAIANFSKFFLLPVMVWRQNITEFGSQLHYLLVMAHYLFALVFVYAVVSGTRKVPTATLIILPIFWLKEYAKQRISLYMDENL